MTARSTFSRRYVLKGAAVGAGTAALASCAPDHAVSGDLYVPSVSDVPVDDPDDRLWDQAPVLAVQLGPQDIALPQNLEPAITSLRVRAVHDADAVAFLLEWDDPDASDLSIRVEDYRDACAVLLAPGPPVPELRPMGTATAPVTLLHWKADWQRDVDEGRQGLEAAYPNRSVDVYPPLWDAAPGDVDTTTYADADATVWLPGLHVENPISVAGRTTPIEKLLAAGFGTSTTATSQDATGRGLRTDTGWKVVITKPLAAVDAGETDLRPGGTATCAFAVWSGGAGEVGSRKAPSTTVYSLVLEH